MPRFDYTARDRSGAAVADALEAPSRRDALRLLTARGLQVGTINERAGGGAGRNGTKGGKAGAGGAKPARRAFLSSSRETPPSRRDRLTFLQALYDLTTSGLSAGESVRLLSQRIKEPTLRVLCTGLWEKLSEGAPLSRAMAAYPEVFDSSTINLIQAGEATGSLNDTLNRLIAYFTEQKEMRRQLIAALSYPVLMVFVAGGVVLFFLSFLLPRLQDLLTSLNSKLPTSTRVLIGISEFSLHYGLFVIGAFIFVAASFWRWRATEAGRATSDAWLLKLPLLGEFIVAQTVLSFSQTLSVLLENGITAAEALRMTERQIGNRVHREAFKTATGRVMEGEALSLALTRTGCFPDLVLDRLAVGENTGNVVPSLKQVGDAYQKIISQRLSFFTTVIATTVLLGVFVFVGFIAFAIVQAVFQASQSMKS
jgi:type II secretory pathway component PulF